MASIVFGLPTIYQVFDAASEQAPLDRRVVDKIAHACRFWLGAPGVVVATLATALAEITRTKMNAWH